MFSKIDDKKKNLVVIELKLAKQYNEFRPFLTELLEKIDCSIKCLVSRPNFSTTNPVMIVSHEYLYGYDHSNEGVTDVELNEFKMSLQSKVDEIAEKYLIDIALAPGTIILKDDDLPGNIAYFFTPREEARYTDKSKETGRLFNWNGKKIFISICCNWSNFTNFRPEADIYFIPSRGYFFLSDQAHANYMGNCVHVVSNQPGIIFINSEQLVANLSGVYQVTASAAGKAFYLCKEPDHLQYLDKREAQILFDDIKISEVKIGASILKEDEKSDFSKKMQFFGGENQREIEPPLNQEKTKSAILGGNALDFG